MVRPKKSKIVPLFKKKCRGCGVFFIPLSHKGRAYCGGCRFGGNVNGNEKEQIFVGDS